MMAKIRDILIAIAFLLSIGGIIWLSVDNHKKDKLAQKYYDLYQGCLHAPIVSDTVHDTIRISGMEGYKPKPLPKPKPTTTTQSTISQIDTGKIESVKNCEESYDDVYRKNGIRFRWTATIKNCQIENMAFGDFVYPKTTITNRVVVDTCLDKEPAYKPKNHVGMDLGLIGRDFTHFPGAEATVWFTIKDKWGLYGGGEYNSIHNEVYGKVGVKLFFK